MRLLGLAGAGGVNEEEKKEARRTMVVAALEHIKKTRADDDMHHLTAAYQDAISRYKRRLAAITGENFTAHGIDSEDQAHFVELSRQLLRIERDTAVKLRDEGRINDEVLRQLERELDLNETRLDPAITI
jgi:CPA1 family monovalent cation:H+ antiporter